MTTAVQGTVYLLHFDEPLSHAQHYMGWALDAADRVNDHLRGQDRGCGRQAG